MIREEIRDDGDLHFIGKTDAQILRELFGIHGRRSIVLPDEQYEHQDNTPTMPDDEKGSQSH